MNSPRSPQTPLSCELKKIINDRNILSMRSRMKVLNSLNENNQKQFEEKEKKFKIPSYSGNFNDRSYIFTAIRNLNGVFYTTYV